MKVAVVGCGLGGMAAALALAARGHAVTILEAFDAPRPVGSGLLLQPTGLAALKALGLYDEILDHGARVERLVGRDTRGRLVMDLDYGYWRADGHGVGIHRGVLFNALHRRLAEAGVHLVTGARIERIEAPSRPLLHDATGRVHGPFDLAVIADGSASTLRTGLRPAARASQYPWGAVWANAPDPDGRFAGALRQVYHRAEVMLGVLPVGRGPDGGDQRLVSMFWSLPVREMDAFFAGDLEGWKARLRELWPETAPLLDHIPAAQTLSRAVYRDVWVGRWNTGATLLIGDAAHGTSPQLGQGANLALVDAVELAERLSSDLRRVPVSIAAYEADRRRHVTLYQFCSWALTPLFQSRGWFWHRARDWMFTPLSKAPGLRRISAAILTGTARLGRWPTATRP